MSQQHEREWTPLGGDAGEPPMMPQPPPTARQDFAWPQQQQQQQRQQRQQHARYPSDPAAMSYLPYTPRDTHDRSRSIATQPDLEGAAAAATFRAAAARSRSATQPSLLPGPTTPLDPARYMPPTGPPPRGSLPSLDGGFPPPQQPARSYSQATTASRLAARGGGRYDDAAADASLEQESRKDPRVRAVVDALRSNPLDMQQYQQQQQQQQQQPPASPRHPLDLSRQPSVMELRPMYYHRPRADPPPPPPQWPPAGAMMPPARAYEASAPPTSPGLLESRRPSVMQRQAAPPPLNVSGPAPVPPGSSSLSAAPTLGKPDPITMTAAAVTGSTPSTADWPSKMENVSYVEHAPGGGGGTAPAPMTTMGDDGGRGGGVAYAADRRVGTATTTVGGNELDKDVVTWDGPDDPANPANWSMRRKYKTSLILSLFSFIAPFSATMVGPAIDVIGAELDIAPPAQQLIQGMQVLAAGIGPFFIAPMIEVYGRADVVRYAHLWHFVWNTACGFSSTGGQLLAFRFIGGLGSSATQILAPGLTADVYPAPMGGRGDAVHAYLPFFGSAIAPIFGAFVTQESNWRWIFWGTSIFSLAAIALAFVALDETYHAVLLERKAARLRKETGNQRLHTPFHDPDLSRRGDWFLKRAALPWFMLVSHPIVQLPFGYRAYLFGIMYLIISTFDRNFVTFYGMDRASASLNYLALGIGFVVGLHISRYAIDGFSAYFRRKHNTDGHRPEWRLPVNGGAAILLPPALILYGWGLQNGLHYIIVDLAAFILAIGLILGFFSLQPYVTESYGLEYAASAHSVGAFLQHIAEFAFPLFGPPITGSDLGFGWGYTLLAAFTLAICVMMPMLLWHFGPAIRRVSTRGLPVDPSARR